MGVWWNSFGAPLSCLLVLVLVSEILGGWSLNDEGLALLQFRDGVDYDPQGALTNWNPDDADPCLWEGVYCNDGKVDKLNLSSLSLKGSLSPELGRLGHLKSLVLYNNYFFGAIPKDLGGLRELELLDLRCNNLSGSIPAEIARSPSLKHLLLSDDKFKGHVPLEIKRVNLLSELQIHENIKSATSSGIGCISRKLGDSVLWSSFRKLNKERSLATPIKGVLICFLNALPLPLFKFGNCTHHGCTYSFTDMHSSSKPHTVQNAQVGSFLRRMLPELPNTNIPTQTAPQPEQSTTNIPTLPTPLPQQSSTNIPTQIVPLPQQSSTNIPTQIAPLPQQSSTNIPALPAPPTPATLSPNPVIVLPTSRSSGGYPAVANAKKLPSAPSPPPSPSPLPLPLPLPSPSPSYTPNLATSVPVKHTHQEPDDTSGTSMWDRYGKFIIIFLLVNLLFIVVCMAIVVIRRRGMTAIGPWKTGLSGQLQKAFVTGVPKLKRSELDIACEDFSNIIETLDSCTIYKGTLSSGVEIAVASAGVTSYKDWSPGHEKAFRKRLETLSRVNHKNFVNLIGYCEENEPFSRMMVFEYVPNGSLFEHLHVAEFEDLDWSTRMRIIMGTAYYLQYIHHELNPPVTHSDLLSNHIYLTDDYAAKIADEIFCSKHNSKEEEISEQPTLVDTKANIYSFGILLLETITGKLPYSEEHGSLVDWAAQNLTDKKKVENMIDPTLKFFKQDELDIICEVIQDCIKPDPMQRPMMDEVVSRLREVLSITPEQAVARLSPLWWAELEILSVEAA